MDHVLLLSLVAALGQPADQPRGPDSHDLRREPGDSVIVDGRPEAAAASGLVRHGPYAAPCPTWKYSRLRPGQRLRPEFLGSRYTIQIPAKLGLSAPGPGRRWIRYGDDAVLIADRDGRVIGVAPGRYR